MSNYGNVKYSDLYCSVCGRKIGRVPGAAAVAGLVCPDPICEAQPAPNLNLQRDAFMVAAVLGGVPVSQIAFANSVSRQRVYQVVETWKKGDV